MFFLLSEVHISFHLIMGTVVLTRQLLSAFILTLDHLATIKRKALESTPSGAVEMQELVGCE